MFEAELHFLLLRGFHYSNKAISQKVLALGLYPGQPKILEYLLEHDGAIAKEIGEGCVIDKSTIANLLLRMERQNLLYKKEHPLDKRAFHIHLTEEGQALAVKVKEICAQTDEAAFRGISRDRQETFLQTLRTILSNLEEGTR